MDISRNKIRLILKDKALLQGPIQANHNDQFLCHGSIHWKWLHNNNKEKK